jgi:hypothetical protein
LALLARVLARGHSTRKSGRARPTELLMSLDWMMRSNLLADDQST